MGGGSYLLRELQGKDTWHSLACSRYFPVSLFLLFSPEVSGMCAEEYSSSSRQ